MSSLFKQRLYYLVIVSFLLLSACGHAQETSSTETYPNPDNVQESLVINDVTYTFNSDFCWFPYESGFEYPYINIELLGSTSDSTISLYPRQLHLYKNNTYFKSITSLEESPIITTETFSRTHLEPQVTTIESFNVDDYYAAYEAYGDFDPIAEEDTLTVILEFSTPDTVYYLKDLSPRIYIYD